MKNKVKIFFNRPIKKSAWGGGSHFITNLHDFLINQGVNVTFSLEKDIDLLFMFEPRKDGESPGIEELLEYKENNKVPIIQRINDTDIARHAYGLSPHDPPWRIKTLLHANKFVDHTVFISDWVKNHYIEHGYEKKNRSDSVIINGSNTNYFYPENTERNDKKLKIITHHWSDNPMKGLDVYIALDKICQSHDNIEFTYLGRYPKGYEPKATKIIPPVYGKEIGDILRKNDVYVTGARYEACGMHHIEAASCGLPVIYHSEGGAIPEVCKKYGKEFNCINSLIHSINYFADLKNRQNAISEIDYNFLSQQRCNSEYLQVIMNTIKGEK